MIHDKELEAIGKGINYMTDYLKISKDHPHHERKYASIIENIFLLFINNKAVTPKGNDQKPTTIRLPKNASASIEVKTKETVK